MAESTFTANSLTGLGISVQKSLAVLASDQTTGLTAGSPLLLATIFGDHTIASNAIKVIGGQRGLLRSAMDVTFSGSGGSFFYRWFIEGGAAVTAGVVGGSSPITGSGHVFPQAEAVAFVEPVSDTNYELQITFSNSVTKVESTSSWATVETYAL